MRLLIVFIVVGVALAWRRVSLFIVCDGCGKPHGLQLVVRPKRVGK